MPDPTPAPTPATPTASPTTGNNRAKLLGPLFVELEAPDCAGAQALFDHWQACKPPDDLPNRRDFPMEVIQRLGLMGYFFVIEPIDGGRDWRYRLMGVRMSWLFGRDVTGVPFREHYAPDEADRCIELSNEVAHSRRPIFLQARFIAGSYFGDLETMSLPVWSSDGGTVWLVGASFPSGDATRWAGGV